MKHAFSLFPSAALAVTLFWPAPTFGQDASDPWASLPAYTVASQDRAVLLSIQERIGKAQGAERAAIEDRLLPVLQSPTATPDSRRQACLWLGLVGSEKSVAPLAALLTDPELAHPARVGLERLSCAAAGKALLEALPKVQGKLLIGVISSLGAKRLAGAEPALGGLLASPEAEVARTALGALGEIGTEAASQVLAAARVSPSLTRDLARARVSVAGHLVGAGKRGLAAAAYRDVMNAPEQASAIRVAAFLGLAGSLPSAEAQRLLVGALEGDDALLRTSAAKAFAAAGKAREGVVAQLPRMQSRGQLLLLGILADAREVPARKPVLKTIASASDPAVKAAALDCLGVHGQADDVSLLAAAAAAEGPTAAAARRSLQRISGRGVDAALLRVVETAALGERKAVLEALPSRRLASALPSVVGLLRGQDPAVASLAAKALGKMGGAAQIQDLARVVTTTDNADLRTAAQEAVHAICARVEDKAAVSRAIDTELERATQPAARAALLPLTPFIGGDSALAQVARSLRDADAQVREVAFRTLVAWPESRAATVLFDYAEAHAESSQAVVALRDGCLRLAEVEEASAEERAAILRKVVQVARRPEEQRRALALMSQVPSPELLEFVVRLTADARLRDDAFLTALQLARVLGAAYPRQSMAAVEELKKLAKTAEEQAAVANGIKAVKNAGQSPQGHVLAWQVSGPYTQADKDGGALFGIAFPPETGTGNVDWRSVAAPMNGILDLRKLMPGDNRVAYLQTTVTSEVAQPAVLELGSDDGIKVWLNGKLVHANNASRPCSPGEDKVNVTLQQGANVLLLKITQSGADWAAVARIRSPEGKPLANVIVGTPAE